MQFTKCRFLHCLKPCRFSSWSGETCGQIQRWERLLTSSPYHACEIETALVFTYSRYTTYITVCLTPISVDLVHQRQRLGITAEIDSFECRRSCEFDWNCHSNSRDTAHNYCTKFVLLLDCSASTPSLPVTVHVLQTPLSRLLVLALIRTIHAAI